MSRLKNQHNEWEFAASSNPNAAAARELKKTMPLSLIFRFRPRNNSHSGESGLIEGGLLVTSGVPFCCFGECLSLGFLNLLKVFGESFSSDAVSVDMTLPPTMSVGSLNGSGGQTFGCWFLFQVLFPFWVFFLVPFLGVLS